uniref:Uncharacterized protein n=1 Tax=Physcomitrium patens TaxID=3218 RepID=A0A2K1K372_PHYPA|nr:hypothetical protein PHYPA_012691 [Physcomitrium patens]
MHTAITQGWNLHELTYQEGSEWESVARCSHVSTAISSSIVGEDSPRIQLNPDADSATNQPKVALLGPKQRRWMGRNGPSHLGHGASLPSGLSSACFIPCVASSSVALLCLSTYLRDMYIQVVFCLTFELLLCFSLCVC